MVDDVRRVTTSDPRVPPQNIEAEDSVLGAMMLSSEAIADVVEIVQADDFYRSATAGSTTSCAGSTPGASPSTSSPASRR